ncbi:MAG TPA: hypothetical protein VM122_09495 [Usitatibacter sp.]|nr:hypothetical protein [Usitatibacter sp.]
MTAGPLHPDNLTNGKDRILGRGHSVGALGPSDTSDSGSDLQGALGEDELASDSDSSGTGERATVERDNEVIDGADIDTDHVEELPREARLDDGGEKRPR